MSKILTAITCFIFVLFRNIAIAQDLLKIAEDKDSKRDTKVYSIKSLDGKSQKVHVMPDYFNHVLRISCLKDTITLNDFWGVTPEVHVLSNNFIEIKYEVRGGSNFGLGNLMLLCISNNKLFEAMHVLRYTNTETGNEHSSYNIKVALNGENKLNYRLNAYINDKAFSRSDRSTNYNYNSQTVLNFDPVRNVFYSIKENIYDSFISNYLKTAKKNKRPVKGNFPVIILGTESYYFINDRWYVPKRNKELDEFK